MDQFFPYDVDRRVAPLLRVVLGLRPARDGVTVDGERFRATFGRLAVDTPLGNIASAKISGPYGFVKGVGLRLSLADSGVTFGTNPRAGVCVTFHEPVDRVIGLRRHAGLTVTVADPDGLVAALEAAPQG